MNRGDLGFGLFIGGIGVVIATLLAGAVYLIVSIAKWAWSG